MDSKTGRRSARPSHDRPNPYRKAHDSAPPTSRRMISAMVLSDSDDILAPIADSPITSSARTRRQRDGKHNARRQSHLRRVLKRAEELGIVLDDETRKSLGAVQRLVSIQENLERLRRSEDVLRRPVRTARQGSLLMRVDSDRGRQVRGRRCLGTKTTADDGDVADTEGGDWMDEEDDTDTEVGHQISSIPSTGRPNTDPMQARRPRGDFPNHVHGPPTPPPESTSALPPILPGQQRDSSRIADTQIRSSQRPLVSCWLLQNEPAVTTRRPEATATTNTATSFERSLSAQALAYPTPPTKPALLVSRSDSSSSHCEQNGERNSSTLFGNSHQTHQQDLPGQQGLSTLVQRNLETVTTLDSNGGLSEGGIMDWNMCDIEIRLHSFDETPMRPQQMPQLSSGGYNEGATIHNRSSLGPPFGDPSLHRTFTPSPTVTFRPTQLDEQPAIIQDQRMSDSYVTHAASGPQLSVEGTSPAGNAATTSASISTTIPNNSSEAPSVPPPHPQAIVSSHGSHIPQQPASSSQNLDSPSTSLTIASSNITMAAHSPEPRQDVHPPRSVARLPRRRPARNLSATAPTVGAPSFQPSPMIPNQLHPPTGPGPSTQSGRGDLHIPSPCASFTIPNPVYLTPESRFHPANPLYSASIQQLKRHANSKKTDQGGKAVIGNAVYLEAEKKAQANLEKAQASWTDFDPEMMVQMAETPVSRPVPPVAPNRPRSSVHHADGPNSTARSSMQGSSTATSSNDTVMDHSSVSSGGPRRELAQNIVPGRSVDEMEEGEVVEDEVPKRSLASRNERPATSLAEVNNAGPKRMSPAGHQKLPTAAAFATTESNLTKPCPLVLPSRDAEVTRSDIKMKSSPGDGDDLPRPSFSLAKAPPLGSVPPAPHVAVATKSAHPKSAVIGLPTLPTPSVPLKPSFSLANAPPIGSISSTSTTVPPEICAQEKSDLPRERLAPDLATSILSSNPALETSCPTAFKAPLEKAPEALTCPLVTPPNHSTPCIVQGFGSSPIEVLAGAACDYLSALSALQAPGPQRPPPVPMSFSCWPKLVVEKAKPGSHKPVGDVWKPRAKMSGFWGAIEDEEDVMRKETKQWGVLKGGYQALSDGKDVVRTSRCHRLGRGIRLESLSVTQRYRDDSDSETDDETSVQCSKGFYTLPGDGFLLDRALGLLDYGPSFFSKQCHGTPAHGFARLHTNSQWL